MPNYNKEDFEKAKQVDIVEFCQANGIALTNDGERYYRLADHDSLVIDRRKNTFYWNSHHKGGDAINFVQTIMYDDAPHSSIKAVETLLDEDKNYLKTEQVHFVAEPYQYQNKEVDRFDRVPQYLHEVRGISKKTINEFYEAGILVQDNFGNAVFKWHGSNPNEIVGASEQGTTINYEKYGKRGTRKIIQKNSTPNFGMSYQIGEPRNLKFFESSIDTMSYRDLHPELKDTLLVSMEGLKQNVVNNYLVNNIKTRQAAPDSIEICVDNDEAGQRFYEDLAKVEYTCRYDDRDVRFESGIPNEPDCKDYNDVLRKQNKQLSAEKNAALSSEISPDAHFIDVLNKVSNKTQVGKLKTTPGQQVSQRLNQLSARLGITVQNNLSPQQFTKQYGQEAGVYLQDSRELLLNPNNSKDQNATTIIRELVHQSFNHPEQAQLNLNTEFIEKQPVAIKQLNADLVAFSISHGLNLDTKNLVDRIKDWRYEEQPLEKLNQKQQLMIKDYISETLPKFENHLAADEQTTIESTNELNTSTNNQTTKEEEIPIQQEPEPEVEQRNQLVNAAEEETAQASQATATIYGSDFHETIESVIKDRYSEPEISRREVKPGMTEETIIFNTAYQEHELKVRYGQQNQIDLGQNHQSEDGVTTLSMSSDDQEAALLKSLISSPRLSFQKITYTANNETTSEVPLTKQNHHQVENEQENGL
ncbi:DUF3991 domain-containing protein [Latilactobacillus fragifolii]|uniref:DUF3991 domain-containing protein n=1 Tax=Latilactobacillus fragifolii TaxID=2814244 RepID=UPI001ABB09E8|nr:DUF3991 domain-containing protein [Latilactobacillus fragifolii]